MQTLKKGFKGKFAGILAVLLLHFMTFGYPIQSIIPFLLNKDSSLINVAFRVLFLIVSMAFIVMAILRSNRVKINYGWAFFLCFWLAYGIRLIYDLELQGLGYMDTEKSYVYSFAFGACLVPSIGIYTQGRHFDHAFSLKVIFLILLISNLCLIYSILSVGNWNITGVLLSRANVNIEIDGVEKSIINPITIGFFGQLLVITAIHLLNFPIWSSRRIKLGLYLCLIIGSINLVFGASRGPFAVLVILIFIDFYLLAKQRKKVFTFFLKCILLVTMLIVYSSVSNGLEGDVELFNRISQTFETLGNGEEERDHLFQSGLKQFMESPIIGDAFVTRYFYLYNSYSHNLFIDVLMSLGMFGLFIFIGLLYQTFRKISLILKRHKELSLYVILFIAQFLTSMLSGALFLSSGFWLMCTLLLLLKLPKEKLTLNADS